MISITFDQLLEKAKKYPEDKEIANTIKIIKAEFTNRFNWKNYQGPDKSWNGIGVRTQPLFCSYGLIGYTACGEDMLGFSYDWDKVGHDFQISWDWEEEALRDLPDDWEEQGINLNEWKKKYKLQIFD